MTGLLHSRLFQASAVAVLAVIFLALGYLGTRGEPPTRNSTFEKLRIAIPMVPHAALLYIAAAKGHFSEEGLEVTMTPTIHGIPHFLPNLYLDALLAVQPARVTVMR